MIKKKKPRISKNSCSLANNIEPLSPIKILQFEWAIKRALIIIITIVSPDIFVIIFAIKGDDLIRRPPRIIPNPAKISPQATK